MTPAPRSRVPKGEVITEPDDTIPDGKENLINEEEDRDDPHLVMRRTFTTGGLHNKPSIGNLDGDASSKRTSVLRRSSSIHNTSDREKVPKKSISTDMREHLKHLGPSNLASRPRTTRYNTVKIKPGAPSLAEGPRRLPYMSETSHTGTAAQGGVGAGLLNSAGIDAKDGVLALQAGYGSISPSSSYRNPKRDNLASHAEETPQSPRHSRNNSRSTIGSIRSISPHFASNRPPARSGSITENIVDAGGFKKTVLELTSSSDDVDGSRGTPSQSNGQSNSPEEDKKSERQSGSGGRKKRRRKKRKDGEEQPLLGGDHR